MFTFEQCLRLYALPQRTARVFTLASLRAISKGCGSSSSVSASGSTLTKDPADRHLDPLTFKEMKVPEFDEYLDGSLAPPVNKLIDLINDINGDIETIKDAAIIVCGGFKVDIELEGATEHDSVLLQLTKADGTLPAADDVKKLMTTAGKADASLAKARKALYKELEAAHVPLSVQAELLAAASPPSSMAAFNTSLGELRTAVGAEYKVSLLVKSAGKGGASAVRFDISKAVFSDPNSEHYVLEPVTVLDVAASSQAKNIFEAEKVVADSIASLTKAVATAEGAGVTTTFELKKKKLVPTMTVGEGDADAAADLKAAVRKAVSSVNSQLFKLFKSARGANGDINLTTALVAVFKSLQQKIASLGPEALKAVAISPTVKISDEGVDFDLGLKLKLPNFEDKGWLEITKSLLPGKASVVLDAVLSVKDTIIAMLPEFKELSESVQDTVQKAEEVFENPTEKVQEAFKDNSDPFAIPKAVAAAAGNLKIATTEPLKIITVMKETLQSMNDEMLVAFQEAKKIFEQLTA
ncbi:hypothetical protein CEUSTIGMA_g1398.t1 [Chlamydomonas eustigma]|uniref:Uncharacterized protein n=1 Tax=Chlamydomonas eustigma TaxID=1157962 RepID=A0A250WSY4_9CHLO|nr:hypothetical protein CEUSTIGMA_g1398.t1 [Chlamydomonas eustigma]|eukprot:GAX73948.1 hypothetical protein CEUSTIGMA_g1398.t1 [Chlamydomonas eustigma]